MRCLLPGLCLLVLLAGCAAAPTPTISVDAPAAADSAAATAANTTGAVATGTPAANCALTRADQMGPFYTPDAPARTSLYPDGTPGQALVISGVVYLNDCATPLPGAVVEIWQADASGNYDFSDQFAGRGQVTADDRGRYTFSTILPAPYEPRPAHIHLRISHPQARALVTQVYFAGETRGAPDALTIALGEQDGVLYGVFDVVLGGE